LSAAQLERLVRAWRRVDRKAENQDAARRQKSRSLSVYQDEDGMFVVRGRLTPEVGAVLRQALAAVCDEMYAKARVNDPEGDPPTIGQQQADAIAIIAETALHHELDPGPSGGRYQVVVHVDGPVLADPEQPGQSVLEDGDHLSAESSRRLACDASCLVNGTARTGASPISARARAPFRPRYAGRSSIGIAGARSPAAAFASRRATTFDTGPTAGRRRSRTWRCCAGGITAPCTRTGFTSSDWPMASWNFDGRMGEFWPMRRQRRSWRRMAAQPSLYGTPQRGLRSMAAPCGPRGRANASTWATRSMSCTRGRPESRSPAGAGG
jgi:Domain of unknown function (DUF222)